MSEWNIQAFRSQERKHIPVVLTHVVSEMNKAKVISPLDF